ncbi:hypothetical protein BDY17DRAFT_289707 [Neohortaea acidophila]|uniref:Myb-like domain-containing protein n=1 Tax=Neohortaea acidophila TaxID=245834 RepID=A0A6A6Q5S6_9PEZI|nr:uncharacterized protein BDY17DRAFT_289707 [Neohortaea acidophila]KAF2487798.1 hypothetical protein BDY17DRAFT_289707 [Neohortaea acidophila]
MTCDPMLTAYLLDLEPVNEDATLEAQLQAGIQEIDDARAAVIEAARGTSAFSPNTVNTTFSQEEIGGLDPDVMADLLPRLADAANDLCTQLLPADPNARAVVRQEIRTDGSRYNKIYNTRLRTFSVNKEGFGSTEYIQPSIVLRALLRVQNMQDVPAGSWRPDAIIHKINLAPMLHTVLVFIPNNANVTPDQQHAVLGLDHAFGPAIAGPGFKQPAFDLCLQLLTQLALIRLDAYINSPAFAPQRLIAETFYEYNEKGEPIFRHYKALDMGEMDDDELEDYSVAITTLVEDDLGSAFDVPGIDALTALETLREKYPWEEFVEAVVEYYGHRKAELDAQIAAVGGVDRIVLELGSEVEQRAAVRAAEAKRQTLSRPNRTPKKGFGASAIRALKAREARLSANAAPVASTAPVAPVAPMLGSSAGFAAQHAATQNDDTWLRPEEDDVEPAQPQQPQQPQPAERARSTLMALENMSQRQKGAKGKGRFIDPQAGAVRVSFDASQSQADPSHSQYPASSVPETGPYYQQSQSTPAKRAFANIDEDEEEEEEYEPTQDQGFETDARDATAADQRRRLAPQQRAPAPRVSAAITLAPPGPSMSSPSSTSKRQRKNPGSIIPPLATPYDPNEDPEITEMEQLERARVAARHHSVISRSQKPPQVRTPWTAAEEMALQYLIRDYGETKIAYAELKSHDSNRTGGPLLGRRSAEDMRFKARNMKQMYLKGRQALPPGFDNIVLDKKAIDKLHSMGIPYEQDRIRGGAGVDTQ